MHFMLSVFALGMASAVSARSGNLPPFIKKIAREHLNGLA